MNAILYWNSAALEANRRDFSVIPGTTETKTEQGGPTLSSRALAIVHLAMYDALAGVRNRPNALPAYLTGLAAPTAGASADAAIAGAAHAALVALFPNQKAHFDSDLAKAMLTGAGVDTGLEFGRYVASALLRDRCFDPTDKAAGYIPRQAPGGHRVDPDNPGQGYHAPIYGAASKCFAVTARHELLPPSAVGTPAYKQAHQQVFGKGIAPELVGNLPPGVVKRTNSETEIGVFWGYDGANGLGTPPRFYNQIVREVVKQRSIDLEGCARLFALVNAAMADAGILAWDQKYVHEFWRPVLGIRENDGTQADHVDSLWLPLGAPKSNSPGAKNFTPNFPAYPSGHATFGAAALHTVRLFLGTAMGDRSKDTWFSGELVSDELNGVTTDNQGTVRPLRRRAFPDGLWQMIIENGLSRVYLGVHWSFDAFALDGSGKPDLTQNVGGVALGLKIAEDIYLAGNKLAPKKSTVGPRC